MQGFKKLIDKWYSDESQIDNNLARSENISYIEILLSPSISRSTLRLLGQLQILHFISPYCNDGRAPLILPTSSSLSDSSSSITISTTNGFEQKRVMNSCQTLLSRLRRLYHAVEQCKIPLPQTFTSSTIPSSSIDEHLSTLRSDPTSIFSSIGEWINSIEQEERSHLQFLDQTNTSLTLSIKLLLTLFMMKTMMEDLLSKHFHWQGKTGGSKYTIKRSQRSITSATPSVNRKISTGTVYGSIPTSSDIEMVNSGSQSGNIEPLDIDAMLYAYDAPLPNQYESYTQRSSSNSSSKPIDRDNLFDTNTSSNVITLYGCVSTSTKSILNTTIQRLSRGNVYISWSDCTFQDQQELLSEIVEHFLLNESKTNGFATHSDFSTHASNSSVHSTTDFDDSSVQRNENSIDQENQQIILQKYLPLSLNQYSLPIFDNLDSFSEQSSNGPFSSFQATNGNSGEERQPQSLSPFFLIFPYSQQLYTKIMKVCGIYNVQFFKIPAPSHISDTSSPNTTSTQPSAAFLSHSGRMYSSQHIFDQKDMYLDLLNKYEVLIERTQHSIFRLLYTRVTTFKTLYQLYLDCCSYQYDSIGTILPSSLSSNDSSQQLPTTSASSQTHHTQILQISTCISLLIEELSILQGEQYLVPFTPPRNDTTSTFLSTTNAQESALTTALNTISYRSPTSTQSQQQPVSQLSILRAFIRTNSINFLNEQFLLFDDECEDGFHVKPFFFFIHTYSRTWITTPLNIRSNPELFAQIIQQQKQNELLEHQSKLQKKKGKFAASDSENHAVSFMKKKFSYPTTENPNPAFEIPPEPPTLFPALPLFLPSQELVNTYAIPSYKELNPALLTIVMFPILFAIMFGDIIHGSILFLAACTLYYYAYHLPSDPILPQVDYFNGRSTNDWPLNETKRTTNSTGLVNVDETTYDTETDSLLDHHTELHKEVNNNKLINKLQQVEKYSIQSALLSKVSISTHYYQHLYNTVLQHPIYKAVSMRQGIILWFLLISSLSIYVGFIYNDAASNPVFLFSSYLLTQHGAESIDYSKYTVYPFGLDPGWYHTGQELTFLNSFKMKMAIIFGILHLYSGIICSLFNHFYFKQYDHIIFSTIPQLLLLTCTFGYMSGLIIVKWCTDYTYWATTQIKWYPQSIIQTMINMFISPPFRTIPQEQLIYSYQSLLQSIFIVIILICVPVLFCAEPLYTNMLHKKWKKTQSNNFHGDDMEYSNKYDSTNSVEGIFIQNAGYGGRKEEKQLFLSPNASPVHQLNSSGSYNTFEHTDASDTTTDVDTISSSKLGSNNNKSSFDHGLNLESLSSHPSEIDDGKKKKIQIAFDDDAAPFLTGDKSHSHNVSPDHGQPSSEADELNPFSHHYNIGTHFVHHGIHSIEFVLGIVSNTASYLRLWALSLAHAQLSNVFWSQLITNLGLQTNSNPVVLCIAMAVWTFSTVGVLLLMDAMECLLHATRLVWVEFQSKFYQGQGYLFAPFSLYPDHLLRGRNDS